MTVPDSEECAVAGLLSHGGDCAHTETGVTRYQTFNQYLAWLEPAPTPYPEPDATVTPAPIIPAHAPAVCESALNYSAQMSALQQACRDLGPACSYATKAALKQMKETHALVIGEPSDRRRY